MLRCSTRPVKQIGQGVKEVQRAQEPRVSWQVMLDDADWDRDVAPSVPSATGGSSPGRSRRAWWVAAGVVLLLAMVVGVRLWQQAQAGLAQVERDLAAVLALEAQARQAGDDRLAEALIDDQIDADRRQRLLQAMQGVEGREPLATEIVGVDLHGDRAMVQLWVTDPHKPLPYRAVRFYRETDRGWLRTVPQTVFWGSPQILESDFFLFHFGNRDGAAVSEAAPVLDEVYLQMHKRLGLPLQVANDPAAKIVVYVMVEEAIMDPQHEAGTPLRVSSPLLHPLPQQVTDAAFLVEQIVLPVSRQLVVEALARSPRSVPSDEFLNGLRLWLAWDEKGLLFDRKADLLRWLYTDASGESDRSFASYQEICQTIELFYPLAPVPFPCYGAKPLPSPFPHIPTELRDLPLVVDRQTFQPDRSANPLLDNRQGQVRGQAMAMATMLEYAEEGYGRTAVPRLLQAVSAGRDWKEVTPLVFDVSAETFEAGWRTWLAEKYGVIPTE